jgi:hypothetical protein
MVRRTIKVFTVMGQASIPNFAYFVRKSLVVLFAFLVPPEAVFRFESVTGVLHAIEALLISCLPGMQLMVEGRSSLP